VVERFRARLNGTWEGTPRATTPSGGKPLFFRYSDEVSKWASGLGWDWQAEGKGVVLPFGGKREWEVWPYAMPADGRPTYVDLRVAFPAPAAGSNGAGPGQAPDWQPVDVGAVFAGVPAGERDTAADCYACSLRARALPLVEALARDGGGAR
jgi:hypothetical protein